MYIILILLGYLLPTILFIIGFAFSKYPPKKINSFSGYRTTRSMKNIDTWNEANKYSANLLFEYSIFLLVIITLGVILTLKSFKLIAIVDLGSVVLSFTFIIVVIVKTENHLKKVFENSSY